MATSPTSSGERSEHVSALTNAELGDLFVETIKAFAAKRTGSRRRHWEKLLDEPDHLAVLAEFRRRALERQEEYDAWVQLHDASL